MSGQAVKSLISLHARNECKQIRRPPLRVEIDIHRIVLTLKIISLVSLQLALDWAYLPAWRGVWYGVWLLGRDSTGRGSEFTKGCISLITMT